MKFANDETMRKCNKLALHFQDKLISELMEGFKIFPRSYVVLSILNEISNIPVVMPTNMSLTFIKKNKDPSSEWVQSTEVASFL